MRQLARDLARVRLIATYGINRNAREARNTLPSSCRAPSFAINPAGEHAADAQQTTQTAATVCDPTRNSQTHGTTADNARACLSTRCACSWACHRLISAQPTVWRMRTHRTRRGSKDDRRIVQISNYIESCAVEFAVCAARVNETFRNKGRIRDSRSYGADMIGGVSRMWKWHGSLWYTRACGNNPISFEISMIRCYQDTNTCEN